MEQKLEAKVSKRNPKCRNWTFTSWDNEPPVFNEKVMKYLAYAQETCPTTGKKHWQGFIGFVNDITMGGVIKRLDVGIPPHVEMMRGSIKSNQDYCSKQGALQAFGTFPRQGERKDIEEFRDHIVHNEMTVDDIAINAPWMHYQYGRTFDKIEDITMRKKFRNFMTKGTWIWGPTGVGKSHFAFENFDPSTHYVLNINDNGWWDGYKQQYYVIINEFRGQIQLSELLDLVDKYPKTVKRRNREPMPFLSRHVIVTSCHHPQEVYKNILKDGESLKQLERRFDIIHKTRRDDAGSGSTEGGNTSFAPPSIEDPSTWIISAPLKL